MNDRTLGRGVFSTATSMTGPSTTPVSASLQSRQLSA
jgi:hypothetical protein